MNFTLVLSKNELAKLRDVLLDQPAREVYELLQKIDVQAAAQIKAREEKEKEKILNG